MGKSKHRHKNKDVTVKRACIPPGFGTLQKGYDKTTVLDITTRADVSRESYYTHLSTKADILATIVIENLIRQIKEIEAIRNTPASGIEKLEKILRLFVDHFLAEPEHGDIAANTEVTFCRNELSHDVARTIVSHIGLFRQQFMQVVGEGIKDGTMPCSLLKSEKVSS
jgi:AcrR family transcriptional regulator